MEAAAASSSPGSSQAVAAAPSPSVKSGINGLDLITAPGGDVVGIAVSPAMQLYTTVDRFVGMSRLMALPIQDRFALAGKIAAVPEEHPRLVERLASSVATSLSENGALNALYILETCQELVPGFKDAVPEGRLEKAAGLSPHSKVQAAVLLGDKPAEWEAALKRPAPTAVMLLPQEEEDEELPDKGLMYDAGRAVGDVSRFMGSAAMGGVGLVSDTLGLTDNAEDEMADGALEAVDLVGDGANLVVDSIDMGLDGTAEDFEEKGVAGTVGDGLADSVDLIQDFATDAVMGIAGGVRSALDWIAKDGNGNERTVPETHKVAIVVAELFGDEKSLGLRLENRILTKFTKPEAEILGWRLGDCIIGVGTRPVTSHEDMLAAISVGKEAMKSSGTPLRFIIERAGRMPVRA